jgi:hypothetical protein
MTERDEMLAIIGLARVIDENGNHYIISQCDGDTQNDILDRASDFYEKPMTALVRSDYPVRTDEPG